ncbi:Tyrosine kinase specific for activated (GTP-bound) p21cdc42Hs [Phaffia rhodozyma]|uniref:Tyrosine kinase specific for activated (GTP-bound) p21cdc42Hs n=1 Tax=Phaffia rhodozyma TaxID=264483 RepID=A0A0F7SJI6_PHARH|nr:Tyrosine kinase specific for activated (GTP-bound) p21cdc42Hs [Phaffia rhodozyma]
MSRRTTSRSVSLSSSKSRTVRPSSSSPSSSLHASDPGLSGDQQTDSDQESTSELEEDPDATLHASDIELARPSSVSISSSASVDVPNRPLRRAASQTYPGLTSNSVSSRMVGRKRKRAGSEGEFTKVAFGKSGLELVSRPVNGRGSRKSGTGANGLIGSTGKAKPRLQGVELDVFGTTESTGKNKRSASANTNMSTRSGGSDMSIGSENISSEAGGTDAESTTRTEYDLIDPSDDHLIYQASRAQLQRTRKDVLIRLLKVAGLWDELSNEAERTKTSLVDLLVDAREPVGPRTRSRSRTSSSASVPLSSASSSSSARSSLLSDDEYSSDADPTPRRPSKMKLLGVNGRTRSSAGSVSSDSQHDQDGSQNEAEGSSNQEEGGFNHKKRGDRSRNVRNRSVSLGLDIGSQGSAVSQKSSRRRNSEKNPSQMIGASPVQTRARGVVSSSTTPKHATTRRTRKTTTSSLPSVRSGQPSPPKTVINGMHHPETESGRSRKGKEREDAARVLRSTSPLSSRSSSSASSAHSVQSSKPPSSSSSASAALSDKDHSDRTRPLRRQTRSNLTSVLTKPTDLNVSSSTAIQKGTKSRGGKHKDGQRRGGQIPTPPSDADVESFSEGDAEGEDLEVAEEEDEDDVEREVSDVDEGALEINGSAVQSDEEDDLDVTEEEEEAKAGEKETAKKEVDDDGDFVEDKAWKRVTRRSGLRKISVPTIIELTEDEEDEQDEDDDEDMQSAEELKDNEDEDDEEGVEGDDGEYIPEGKDSQVGDIGDGETEVNMDDDDDIDLSNFTHATLLRLRRDALVRLCSSRDIEVVGTKPQLAQALLDWRDNEGEDGIDDSSSISSASTARPNSTSPPKTRRPRRLHDKDPVFRTNAKITPTLYQPGHVHHEQKHPSVTPPPSGHAHQGGIGTEELNLDLESLGLEDKEIPCEQLVKMEKVGSGGFKDVYVGKLRNRMKVAIAEFRGQLSEMDIKELKLLADFNHPNVVKFLGVSIPEDRKIPIMMISELCENGDLFDYIRNVPAPSKKVVIKLMLDISRGLNYLHTRKPAVIHRDVSAKCYLLIRFNLMLIIIALVCIILKCKSSNILITSKVVAKVGDFGLARVKHSTRSLIRSLVGTVCYQPPEMWTAHPKYDSKVDVYSCAMVFWEMLQWHKPEKKYPWEGMNEHAIYDTVGSKKQRPSTHKVSGHWGIDIVELMEHMWVQDPKQRPTMAEVVERLEVILKTA